MTWPLVRWVAGRLLATAILLGSSWLLYYGATSPDFHVARIRIAGNRLTTADEIEAAAAIGGTNVFWLRPEEVTERLVSLPPVAAADVQVLLPDLVEVRIRERTPFAVWQAGDTPFLVDESGMILASEPPAKPMVTVHDQSQRPLRPGDRVDTEAIQTAAALSQLLEAEGIRIAGAFEYRPETGIEIDNLLGWRVRFGSSEDLAWKVRTLRAMQAQFAAANITPSLVDLRFKGRPYYR